MIQRGNLADRRPDRVALRCLTALFCLEWACKLYFSSPKECSSRKSGGIKRNFWIYFLGGISLKLAEMDITVSELMANFMDTPLVVWVRQCAELANFKRQCITRFRDQFQAIAYFVIKLTRTPADLFCQPNAFSAD